MKMIRRATESDFEYLYELYMHPQVNPYLLYEMMDKTAFRPICQDLLDRGIKYIYSVDDQQVGMFKVAPMLHRNAHIAYIGGVAIHPDFSGKGYGTRMMQDIVDFALGQGFTRLELSTATFNHKAIRVYEKIGFQKEGVLRNFTHLKSEDRYIDEMVMAYLRM